MKVKLFSVLVFLGILIIPSLSFGSIVAEQNFNGYTQDVGNGNRIFQTLDPSGISGSLSDVTVKVKANSVTTSTLQVAIVETDVVSSSLTGQFFALWSYTLNNTSTQLLTFTVNEGSYSGTSSLAFKSNKYYLVFLYNDNPSGISVYGDSANSYIYSDCYYQNPSYTSCSSINDLFFIVEADGASSTPVLRYPTNFVDINDFSYWVLSVNGNFSGRAHVRYGQSSSSYTYDDEVGYDSDLISSPFQLKKTQSLKNIYNSTSSLVWFAQPYLVSGTTSYFGSQITFSINQNSTSSATAYSYLADPYSSDNFYGSASSTLENCAWNDWGGCLINAFSWTLGKLFTPHKIITDQLQDSFEQFQGIFPFSIPLTILEQNKQNFNISSTQLDMNFPLPFNSTTIKLLSSSTLKNYIGSSNTDLWLNTISTFLWLFAGLVMFKMII